MSLCDQSLNSFIDESMFGIVKHIWSQLTRDSANCIFINKDSTYDRFF